MSHPDDSALPAMQRAAQQLPPGWEIGALFPGTETREVLHRDWHGTPITLHFSDDHPMRLTWTCGAVSVREFKDFAKTSLANYPELMQLIAPRSSLRQMMDAYDDLVVAEDDLKRAVEAESSGVPYTPSTAASPSAVLDQVRATLALAGLSGDVLSAVGELLAERDALRVENTRLAGLRPELPPFPPEGDGLPRYGLRWNGPKEPIAVPMDDGYWTPWHLADALHNELKVQYSLYLGIKKRLGLFPEDGRLPHDSIDALQAELTKLRQEQDQVIVQLLESNRENLLFRDVLDQQAEQLKGTPEQRRERLAQLCVQVRLRLLEKGRLHGVSELGIDAAIACHAERLAAQAERDELRAEKAQRSEELLRKESWWPTSGVKP